MTYDDFPSKQILAEVVGCGVCGDADAIRADVDGLTCQQTHELGELVEQVRAAHSRDGVHRRVDGFLQLKLVLLHL